MKLFVYVSVSALLFLSTFGHTVWKQTFPTPKGFHHGKPTSELDKLRKLRVTSNSTYKDRFLEQYGKIMNTSNGYFSSKGVPYHSVETLICEAPDYGHETTSEAFSYYIWLQSVYGWATGDMSQFTSAWELMENTIIPSSEDQPTTSSYNPQSPATYAPEEDSPSDYPVQLQSDISVGVDPLNDELATVYGTDGTTLDIFYATHWLMDVDNIYGFGIHEDGSKTDQNIFLNTFQRGPNESVWRTIPQPEWEDVKYGDTTCGFVDLFVDDPNGCKPQWRYTGAPDADARSIQAVYWAIQYAKTAGQDISTTTAKAQKLGDFLRYSLWDKYFKSIPCYSPNCAATTWSDSWNSTFYLISWYYAWGGNIGEYDWGWRIGASHVHHGYQNILTAYALSTDTDLMSKTTGGVGQWETVKDRTLEFYTFLQSSEGAIAGGATNSWKGRYADPTEDGITAFFYGMPYDWQPVYHCPPSNNWFGMQAWSMERLAEYLYVTNDAQAKTILDNWYSWFSTLTLFPKNSSSDDDNDWQVPSTLNWSGQPESWNGFENYKANSNLHVKVVNYAKDVGVGSSTAQLLAYYAKATSNSDAQNTAAELLDRMYLYADDQGIGCEEERQDYIGNAYGKGFNEPVYVPTDYTGTYPNGDQIKNGDDFTDIRTFYKDDPSWSYIEQCQSSNTAPVFTYHRMWAQAGYAIACADYSKLFES